MSGPAKVALSLRHAMRRWLISLPAASDRSKRSAGFLSIPGIAIWKGPRSRCLCDTQCGDGSYVCRLHLIARSDLPASFPSQALPSGKDVRTCQGRAVRSAGFLSIPGIAIWKGPRSRCLCDTQCGDGSYVCRLHLMARSDLPASFPSQALPSGKDVRTCQGRAVFATRNAAMAHLSAGCI